MSSITFSILSRNHNELTNIKYSTQIGFIMTNNRQWCMSEL